MALVRKVALFGASGAMGQSVAPELERRGIPYRVVGRSRQKLQQAFGGLPHAEIFPADLVKSWISTALVGRTSVA